jgi:hypothetical protein
MRLNQCAQDQARHYRRGVKRFFRSECLIKAKEKHKILLMTSGGGASSQH